MGIGIQNRGPKSIKIGIQFGDPKSIKMVTQNRDPKLIQNRDPFMLRFFMLRGVFCSHIRGEFPISNTSRREWASPSFPRLFNHNSYC